MRCAVLVMLVLFACCGAVAHAQAPDGAVQPSAPATAAPSAPAQDDARLDLQKPEEETPKAAESWWQSVLRAAPNCKSFTDGCRTCSQTICSNIGIACQPKDWSCNDSPNVKPEAAPDEKPESKQ
jgi:hypothetical protein